MKRRNFLKTAMQALPLAICTPSLLNSCAEEEGLRPPNGKSVLVLGAGISGLSAATTLVKAGFAVTVLEARNAPGGRIRTNRTLGLSFDEGASWIHGPRGNPLTELAKQAGAKTFLTSDESVRVFGANGSPYSDTLLSSSERQYEQALHAVRNNGSLDKSVADLFRALYPERLNDPLWKYFLSAYLEFDIGGDMEDISSIDFDDDEAFAGEDVLITNGYDTLIHHLARTLDIRLGTRVERVNYTGDTVRIYTSKGDFDADYALVTLPLGVLKEGVVEFIPQLSETKTSAIERIQMGNVNKFLLLWDRPFWDESLQYIGYTPAVKGKFNYFLNVKKISSISALMTFAFGNYATASEALPDAAVQQEIMQHLRSIYGTGIPAPTGFLRTRWQADPFARGAYSFATVGTRSSAFDTLAQSVGQKLFFAGEHTHRAYRGTAHGAYLSGVREAEKIMRL